MRKLALLLTITTLTLTLVGCSSSAKEERYQEDLMNQAADEIGMPEISEFYEKKLAKEIFELRDNSKLVCYAYTTSQVTGKYVYIGQCVGYGLPYSTQFTSPEKYYSNGATLPQADPNGLYSPDGLDATWLWLVDEETGEPSVVYMEPDLVVTQKKLPERICEDWSLPDNY